MDIPRNETAANNNDRLSSIFRTEGFNEFLGKFEDAHSIDVDSEAEIVRRFEIFQKLPEVLKLAEQYANEQNFPLLQRNLTPEELAGIKQELERRVFQEKDFNFINHLDYLNIKNRQLQKDIPAWEIRLAKAGKREDLEREKYGINAKIHRQFRRLDASEKAHENVVMVKETVGNISKLKEGVKTVENSLYSEVGVIVGEFKTCFADLERMRAVLAAVDKKSVFPGRYNIPNFEPFKKNLDKLQAAQKDPKKSLKVLNEFDFTSGLANAKKDLLATSTAQIEALTKIQGKKHKAKQYPQLNESLAEFRQVRTGVLAINIDSAWSGFLESIESDLSNVEALSLGLSALERDPSNARVLEVMNDSLSELQSPAGIKVAGALKVGMAELLHVTEHSDLSQQDARLAAAYERKGLLRKLISRDPEKKAAKKVTEDSNDVHRSSMQRDAILEKIDNLDTAERMLNARKQERQAIENYLMGELKSLKIIGKKVRADTEKIINNQMQQEDVAVIIKSKGDIDRLVEARQAKPELYGDMANDDYDTSLHGNRNLRDLKKDYEEELMHKVAGALKKTFESMEIKTVTPDSLALKLKEFEDGLGALANTKQYQNVRLQAFRELGDRSTVLHASKKIAMRRMLTEAEKRGFLNQGRFDIKGFLKVFEQRPTQTVSA